MKTTKPEPVPAYVICSLCGLDWPSHGDDPTTLDCIRLLKARMWNPIVRPHPVSPYWWYNTNSASTVSGSLTNNVTHMTPRDGDTGSAVA